MSLIATSEFTEDAEKRMLFNMQMAILDQRDQIQTMADAITQLVSVVSNGIKVTDVPDYDPILVPAPVINVPETTFDANAIAAALAPVIAQMDMSQKIDKLLENFISLTKDITKQRGMGGASSISTISTHLLETKLDDIRHHISDYEDRLTYDGSNNLQYLGRALNGTETSASTWNIQKLSYDVSNNLTRVQVLTGSWDARTSLGW